VIDPRHYDGLPTDRVMPPPPMGRMGRRLQELAEEPVVHRSIDLYARLLEVARCTPPARSSTSNGRETG
jgi:hypothetical protein